MFTDKDGEWDEEILPSGTIIRTLVKPSQDFIDKQESVLQPDYLANKNKHIDRVQQILDALKAKGIDLQI